MKDPKIDTVPLPDRPVRIRIPHELFKEFEDDIRVIVGPSPQGLILVPWRLIDSQVAEAIRDEFEVVLVPKDQLAPMR